MSWTPTTRPAWARRCGAGSRTARRTWRWRRWRSPGCSTRWTSSRSTRSSIARTRRGSSPSSSWPRLSALRFSSAGARDSAGRHRPGRGGCDRECRERPALDGRRRGGSAQAGGWRRDRAGSDGDRRDPARYRRGDDGRPASWALGDPRRRDGTGPSDGRRSDSPHDSRLSRARRRARCSLARAPCLRDRGWWLSARSVRLDHDRGGAHLPGPVARARDLRGLRRGGLRRVFVRTLLAGTRRLVVAAGLELLWEVARLEALRVVVRVDVALALPEPAAVPRAVAQRLRRPYGTAFLHVGRRAVQRQVARVRLRRAGKVDRGLGEIEACLGQSDVLDRLGGGDRDKQRASSPPSSIAAR